jgi:methionine-rich copper-binding protein CopC
MAGRVKADRRAKDKSGDVFGNQIFAVNEVGMRQLLAIALLILGALAVPDGARAHSGLARSSPPAGGTVKAPKEVVLTFTEKLEPKFSSIEVRDTKGAAVHDSKASGVPAQPTQMRVSLKPLVPGTYKVIWRILSVDTHRASGSFTFRVVP